MVMRLIIQARKAVLVWAGKLFTFTQAKSPPPDSCDERTNPVKRPPAIDKDGNILIKDVFDQFLTERQAKLAPKTYRHYELVIGLFADQLNGYAWNYLDDGDNAYSEAVEQEKSFIELYDHSYIADNVEEFLNDFVPRKVAAGDEFSFTICPRVVRSLLKWMRDQHLVELTNAEINELCEN